MSGLVALTARQAEKLPVGTQVFVPAEVRTAGLDYDGDLLVNPDRDRYVAPSLAFIKQDVLTKAMQPQLPTAPGSIIKIDSWYGVSHDNWFAMRTSRDWVFSVDGTQRNQTDMQNRVAQGNLVFTEVAK